MQRSTSVRCVRRIRRQQSGGKCGSCQLESIVLASFPSRRFLSKTLPIREKQDRPDTPRSAHSSSRRPVTRSTESPSNDGHYHDHVRRVRSALAARKAMTKAKLAAPTKTRAAVATSSPRRTTSSSAGRGLRLRQVLFMRRGFLFGGKATPPRAATPTRTPSSPHHHRAVPR